MRANFHPLASRGIMMAGRWPGAVFIVPEELRWGIWRRLPSRGMKIMAGNA